jgi:aspartate/methionine/tyrosine aminotransferase
MKIKLADRVAHVEEYYFSRKLKEIAQMRANGMDIINLGIGSPDLHPDEAVVARLCMESQNHDQHGYQSYIGIPQFRQAIATWYKEKFQVELDPCHEILPLMGSKECIMHISMTYLQADDIALVPDPGYPTYQSATLLAGATPITYKLDEETGWLPQLNDLSQTDLSRVKIMWVNYPHMPTGATASRAVFKSLVEFAIEHQILLCHDSPYAFIQNNHPLSLLKIKNAKNVVIELSSLSKTYNMAGWRVGFMAAHADRIRDVLRFKSNMDSGMFKPIQLAAVEALQQPQLWHDKMNQIYSYRRLIAESILTTLGCSFNKDQAGMFVWAKIPGHAEDGHAFIDDVLRQTGVFMTPGNIFGNNGRQYVRISLCAKEHILQSALERVTVYNSSLKSINT